MRKAEHKDWCASLTQRLASDPPRPAPCNCKPEQEPVDWEAVAADQAMTIAMMKIENRREWVGLEDETLDDVTDEFYKGAVWAEAKLKEKNGYE